MLAALAGCTAGENYGGPPAAGSASVARGAFPSAKGVKPSATVTSRWWDDLGDKQLTALIDRALASAPDIEIALARLDQAEARVDRARGADKPVVSAGASAVGMASSEQPAPQLLPGRTSFAAYDAGLRAGWEPDFFGRARRQRERASARRDASAAMLADAQVVLSAAVAQTYLQVRAEEANLRFAQDRFKRLDAIAALAGVRTRGGTGTQDAEAQAKADRGVAEGQMALAEAALISARNDLSALVGAEPGELEIAPGDVPLPPADLRIADPASVIRNRPDIRAAERGLAAASADHALAVAEKFPHISLFGVLGVGGAKVDGPLTAPSLLSLVMPRLSVPIFDGGRIKADIRQSAAAQTEASASYRKAVLNSLRDCDTALARFGAQRIVYAQALASEEAAETSARLTALRRAGGTADNAASERAALKLAEARMTTSLARTALTSSYVSVMKAMGFGWQPR